MEPSRCSPSSKLGLAAEAIYSANKALRDVIHVKDDEVARLDEFERKFRDLKSIFEQYKKMELKHAQKTKGYQACIQQELVNDEHALESLNKEIVDLNRKIKEQAIEIDKFGRDLKDNVEKLVSYEDGFAPPPMSDHSSIMKHHSGEQAI